MAAAERVYLAVRGHCRVGNLPTQIDRNGSTQRAAPVRQLLPTAFPPPKEIRSELVQLERIIWRDVTAFRHVRTVVR